MSEQTHNEKYTSTILSGTPISILDLAPVTEEGSVADSLHNTIDLAQHAERWGYHRYWLAEHHNMPGIASSATSIVIGQVAAHTKQIRVGAGGIMLPNHSPLVIAEQFGTLESLFPGRIDLGLGRAPGSDGATSQALRRGPGSNGQDFPERLRELRAYFQPDPHAPSRVRAIPGEGLNIPIWLLGSSGFSAELAGRLGLPFSFASHFAPEYLMPALELYRGHFTPSEVLDKPHVMIAVNAVVADTDEQAKYLATSQQQQFLNLIRGKTGRLQPPTDDMDSLWNAQEKALVQGKFSFGAVGSKATVAAKLESHLELTGADEMILSAQIYDHAARLHSYSLLAEIFGSATQM